MRFRNYVARTLLLFGLALLVGIAVALMSGDERARTVRGSTPTAIEHPTPRAG
jgi:hypothetical protein